MAHKESVNENVCVICLDDIKNRKRLKCNHTFCKKCISYWFMIDYRCPVCRHDTSSEMIFKKADPIVRRSKPWYVYLLTWFLLELIVLTWLVFEMISFKFLLIKFLITLALRHKILFYELNHYLRKRANVPICLLLVIVIDQIIFQ
jgi:hypothetical protein